MAPWGLLSLKLLSMFLRLLLTPKRNKQEGRWRKMSSRAHCQQRRKSKQIRGEWVAVSTAVVQSLWTHTVSISTDSTENVYEPQDQKHLTSGICCSHTVCCWDKPFKSPSPTHRAEMSPSSHCTPFLVITATEPPWTHRVCGTIQEP